MHACAGCSASWGTVRACAGCSAICELNSACMCRVFYQLGNCACMSIFVQDVLNINKLSVHVFILYRVF